MADKDPLGPVSFEIAGNSFEMDLTHRQVQKAQNMLGSDLFDYDGDGLTFNATVAFCALEGQHDIRSVDDVLDLMDEGAMVVNGALSRAIQVFYRRHYQDSQKKATA